MALDEQTEKRLGESFQKAQDALNVPSPLGEIWKKSAEIRIDQRQTQKLNREMRNIAEESSKRHQAILDTAENTGKINEKVESIESSLESERATRESSDKQNHDDAVRWHRIDLMVAIIGVLLALAGVIISLAR